MAAVLPAAQAIAVPIEAMARIAASAIMNFFNGGLIGRMVQLGNWALVELIGEAGMIKIHYFKLTLLLIVINYTEFE